MPGLAFRHDLRLAGADFLVQFAQGGVAWALALVDTALGHLPAVRRVEPPADPYHALAVDQHDAGAGPVRQIFGIDAGHAVPRSLLALIIERNAAKQVERPLQLVIHRGSLASGRAVLVVVLTTVGREHTIAAS